MNWEEELAKLNDEQKGYLKKILAEKKQVEIANKNPQKLSAYILAEESHFDTGKLKSFLEEKIPAYMIPSSFYTLQSFPKLSNGKVDKKALAKMVDSKPSGVSKDHVTNKLEQEMIRIWEQVLNRSSIGVNDDFFELGGDSISSIQIIAKAKKSGIVFQPDHLLEHSTIHALCKHIKSLQASEDKTENSKPDLLLKIWSEVLSYDNPDMDDDFFEQGGDSISSIRLVAKAKKVGLHFKPEQLFEASTPRQLLAFIDLADHEEQFADPKEVKIQLSPIQHWFFDKHKTNPHLWNQSLRFSVSSSFGFDQFSKAFKALQAKHEALRLFFSIHDDAIVPELMDLERTEDLLHIQIRKEDESEAETIIQENANKVLEQFNLNEGSLVKALFFEFESQSDSILLITAHHLVIDQNSWRILMDDYQDFVLGKDASFPPNYSYSKWSSRLLNEAQMQVIVEDLSYWNAIPEQRINIPFSRSIPPPYLHKDRSTLELTWSGEQSDLFTEKLKQDSKSWTTIMVAYAHTLAEWTHSEDILIGLEDHGRRGFQTNVYDTVGWFTNFYPFLVKNISGSEPEELLRNTQKRLKEVPNNGLSYGLLRYINQDLEVKKHQPRFIFNYWGQDFSLTNSVLKNMQIDSYLSAPDNSENSHVFELNLFIRNNKLVFRWQYFKSIHDDATVQKLLDRLSNLSFDYLNLKSDQQEDLEDFFPDSGLDSSELDDLLGSI